MRLSSFLFSLSAISAVIASPVTSQLQVEKRSQHTDLAATWEPTFKAWHSALTSFPSVGLEAVTETGAKAVDAVFYFRGLGAVPKSDVEAISKYFDNSLPDLKSALILFAEKRDGILAAGPPDNKYLFQGYAYGFWTLTNYIFDNLAQTAPAPYPEHFKELQAQLRPALEAAWGAYFSV